MTATTEPGGNNGTVVLFNGVDTADDADSPRLWAPLSILAIGTALNSAGYHVELLDCQIEPAWRERLAGVVRTAVFLGVSCMTGPGIRNVLEAVDLARATAPDIPVVWGGYHATLAYEGILRERLADVVVAGSGETAAIELARVFSQVGRSSPRRHRGLAKVGGIAYEGPRRMITGDARVEPEVVRTTPEDLDMNLLPPMDYALLDPTRYYTATNRKLPYITSYGCPHACGYCSEPIMSQRRWRSLEPRRVVAETTALWDRYAPDAVDFMDPNFSTSPARVVEFVQHAMAADGEARYMCNMRARDVTVLARLMDLADLRRAGLTRVFMGVESGSDRVLVTIRKGSRVKDTLAACAGLAQAGIEVHTSFMHDLPDETEGDSDQTMALSRALAQMAGNRQSHHFFTPYPGTDLYQRYFGVSLDASVPQAVWASSSTYRANSIWAGRRQFRERVLGKLEAISADHEVAFAGTRLPHLEKTEAL
jgi:radical SAM superfamily enzyme YgiQ (UPF0313 family)